MHSLLLRSLVGICGFALLMGCGETALNADTTQRASDSAQASSTSQNAPAATGAPAQPAVDGPVSDNNTIIAKNDTVVEGKPSCRIEFAYAGYAPEDVIWDGESCDVLTADFIGRDQLEKAGKWERLDDYAREKVSARADGQVFYIEGEFTASIYPIDYNNLTYEVSVAD